MALVLKKYSIRRSVATTLLSLAIGPLLLLGCVLAWYSFEVQQQHAIDFQQEISKRAATEINHPIQELKNDLITAANIYDITHLSRAEQFKVLSRLQSSVNSSHRNILTKLTLTDTQGMELTKVSISDIYLESDLTNISASEEFAYVIEHKTPYFSPVWHDAQTGDPRLTISIPWFNIKSSAIDVILIAELRLKELWNHVMDIKVGLNGQIFVINDQGRVIAHRNPSVVLRGNELTTYEEAGFQKNLQGKMASLTATEIKLGNQRIHVIAELPLTEALDLTINTLISIGIMMAVALLASVVFGYIMVHRMITPIESLAETTKAISLGDFHRRAIVNKKEDEIALLARSFNTMTSQLAETIANLKSNVAHIDHLAHYDPLTELPNRRLLDEILEKCLAEGKRHNQFGAVLFIDLDRFKTINDSLGHPVGDELLIQVAKRLSNDIRIEDTVARLGGDEFVIVLHQLSNHIEGAAQGAQQVADKTLSILTQAFKLENSYYRITASIGVSIFPNGQEVGSDILKQADTAMYRSKDCGRNTINFYNPEMQHAVDERLSLEKEMLVAIRNDEFELYYQPVLNANADIVGVESLLRWNSPSRGLVSPESFITLAEETGLIIPIGDWVLRTACSKFVEWSNENKNLIQHIAVNISYQQFLQDDFIFKVKEILSETKMPPNCLTLEITESILMTNVEEMIIKISALKNIGIHFAIDDFGTGYSSLSYLSRLPVDILKIDKSFVRNLPYHKDGAEITETIIGMANNLRLDIIAEGVETAEQFNFLTSKGSMRYQGYLFSKPLRGADIPSFALEYDGSNLPQFNTN